jgi:EAL domain-containing protein (putative c-di-GMP-specific phosphodiesterase class I)/GGDEF domain-containing protein
MQRGVATFDIDTFAMLMATHGPDAADEVLTRFGEILTALETPGAFAHWREDTFVWIVDCADAAAALDATVAAVRDALREPFLVQSERIWLTTSVGLSTTALVRGGDLLAAASDAMEVAKRAGGSNCTYYEESMESGASSGFRLANELHHAIDHDELRLHYQPIMDLATNEVTGVEALVRWERPGLGLLTPAHFIDAAERTGQIVPLGNWVIAQACENAPSLGHHSHGPRTMSINVSARQLADPGLIATLRGAITSGGLAPFTIVIEVTESVLLDDLSGTAASLEAIKALEVGLDLDDFGTGYSSLQYLKNLPIDRIKVDRSFVAGLGTDATDTAIIASTIALAHSLGLRAIAEGVETDEQLTLLRGMGCDFAQGYLISRPTDLESLTAWLGAYVPIAPVPPAGVETLAASFEATDAAQEREAQADTRELNANSRETRADERDRAADVRDETATRREANDGGRVDAATRSTRRSAERARGRAHSARALEARGRAEATRGRNYASTLRADEASRPHVAPIVADDDAAHGP